MAARPLTPSSKPCDSNGLDKAVQSPPQTPVNRIFALTEYSANATPPHKAAKTEYSLPSEFLLDNGTPDYLRLILTSKVYEVVKETPLTHATNLSNRLEANVLLKREDLQPVFSFKLRGAYNKMAHLSHDEKWKGVVACSAGNHAQGVAYSARELKIPATIVMPSGTPAIKHLNVGRLGGHVVLHGEDFDAAKEKCSQLAHLHGLTQIPPFDDPYVIAGQGTIGMEILRQTNLSELKAIFCCIGGGGLIAGLGVYVKRIAPHVKIIGVETYDANAMTQSLREEKRVVLKEVGLFADGAAVKMVGQETFRLCTEVVDEVIQVTTDEVCAAIKDCFEDTRSILEPAGALAIAGLKKYVSQQQQLHQTTQGISHRRKGYVAVASGANMNFDRLRFVAERAALGEKRESLFMATIPEQPGSFLRLIEHINPLAVNEFRYRFEGGAEAPILVGVELSASNRIQELSALFKRLDGEGIVATDLSEDEVTKSHLRYLIGGRSNVVNERLFSFEFPERGGALYKFLSLLDPGINISLFHYRNYGGDVGKVLAAFQCGHDDEVKLDKFLSALGYPHHEETTNDVFQAFLRQKESRPVSAVDSEPVLSQLDANKPPRV